MDTTNTHFPLLDLIPELRNRIYRFALQHETIIHVTRSGYDRHLLLNTCHQVRREALAIYDDTNHFQLFVRNYDSETMYRFQKTLPRLKGVVATTGSRCQNWRPHWRNLLKWLQRCQDGTVITGFRTPGELRTVGTTCAMMVLGGMFAMVRELKHVRWEDVERVLVAQRPMLMVHDARWGQDE